MAGPRISFLDLVFADALATGLARAAQRRAERPPPDNFYVLPNNIVAWKLLHATNKKENMVVAIEFTDNSSPACKSLQPQFVDLAREFDDIPFLRVVIGPGSTFNEVRSDVGGVEYTPSLLVLFYDDDGISRAKWEGTMEVRGALDRGLAQAVIRELVGRRVKLKLAERLAEQLAFAVMGERERRIRTDFEDHMKQMLERRKKEQDEKEAEVQITNITEEKDKLKDEMEQLRRQLEEKEKAMQSLDKDFAKLGVGKK